MLNIFDDLSQNPSNQEKDKLSLFMEDTNSELNTSRHSFKIFDEDTNQSSNPKINSFSHLDAHKQQALLLETNPQKPIDFSNYQIFGYDSNSSPTNSSNKQMSPSENVDIDLSPTSVFREQKTNIFSDQISNSESKDKRDSLNRNFKVINAGMTTKFCSNKNSSSDEKHENSEYEYLAKNKNSFNVKGKKNPSFNSHLWVTEESYTEKFDYKKFINQELTKLGRDICGQISLFGFERFSDERFFHLRGKFGATQFPP